MGEQRQSRPGATGRMLLALAALAMAGVMLWLYARPPAADAPAQSPAGGPEAVASATMGTAPSAAGAATPLPASAVPPAAGASVPAWVANATAQAMEKFHSPAEALRKVQVALGGGTPEEVREAANTRQMCAYTSGASEAMYAMRDRPNETPEMVRKMIDQGGGINKAIESAQQGARRCQVFDAATMGRRMELFQRALDGGAEGAAAQYLTALQSPLEKQKPDPALVAKLQADVRTAAAAGDTLALQQLSLVTGDSARELGVTPAQREAYHAAWKIIMDERHPGITAIIEKATAPFVQPASAPALSGAEKAEANALAQQIVDSWRRKRKGG